AVAVGDPGERADHHAFAAAGEAQRKPPLAALVFERAVAGDGLGLGGEALDPHRAAHPMRRPDDSDADARAIAATGGRVAPAGAPGMTVERHRLRTRPG